MFCWCHEFPFPCLLVYVFLELEHFALYPFECLYGSFAVGCFAIVPPERELVAIPMKVLLGDVMKRAVYASLQKCEERFSSVRIDITANVFTLAVVNCLMSSFEFLPDSIVQVQIVRLNRSLRTHILADSLLKIVGVYVLQDPCPCSSAALHKHHYRSFLSAASAFVGDDLAVFVESTLARLSANVDFVYFHYAFEQTRQRVSFHCRPDSVCEMPSGLVGMKPKIPLKLKCRYSLLMRAHRVERLYPLPESDVAAVHYRPDSHSKLTSAIVALDNAVSDARCFGVQSCDLLASAVRTRGSVRPVDTLKDGSGLFLSQTSYVNSSHIGQSRELRRYVFHSVILS